MSLCPVRRQELLSSSIRRQLATPGPHVLRGEAWPRVSKAIGDAIDWIRDSYGVVRGDMIPYEAMLAVLACYFAEHGSRTRPSSMSFINVEKKYFPGSRGSRFGIFFPFPQTIGNIRKPSTGVIVWSSCRSFTQSQRHGG